MHADMLEAVRRKSQKKRENGPKVSARPSPPASSPTIDNLVPSISPSVPISSPPVISSLFPLLDPPNFVFPKLPEELTSPSILQNPNFPSPLVPISEENALVVDDSSPIAFKPSSKASPSSSSTSPLIVFPAPSSPTLPEDVGPSLTSQNPNSSSPPFSFVSKVVITTSNLVVITTSNLSPLALWFPPAFPTSLSQEVPIYPSSSLPSYVLSRSSSENSLPFPIEVIQYSDVTTSSSILERELTLLPLPSPPVSLPSRNL